MMISGKGYWCKVVGAPVPNKFKPDVPQWAFDLSIDEATEKELLGKGMSKSSLKNKGDDRGTFITFTRDAVKKDGTPGKPFSIVDNKKNPWDNRLIGNGSELNVVVSLNERTYLGKTFLKPSAVSIQVWTLVEYKSGEFQVKDDTDEQKTGTDNW
jgi:hypothetical protein